MGAPIRSWCRDQDEGPRTVFECCQATRDVQARCDDASGVAMPMHPELSCRRVQSCRVVVERSELSRKSQCVACRAKMVSSVPRAKSVVHPLIYPLTRYIPDGCRDRMASGQDSRTTVDRTFMPVIYLVALKMQHRTWPNL
uniref:Uncharacterized protein n=1 Tax=Strigamia maritima TaxID=126957 RepID=T1IN25_STRMM